jgi:hypothetical protein
MRERPVLPIDGEDRTRTNRIGFGVWKVLATSRCDSGQTTKKVLFSEFGVPFVDDLYGHGEGVLAV